MEGLVKLEGGWLMIASGQRACSHDAVWCSDLAVCELIMVLPAYGHVRSVCFVQDGVGIVLVRNCI